MKKTLTLLLALTMLLPMGVSFADGSAPAADNYYEFSLPRLEPDMGAGGLSWNEIEKKHRAFAVQYDYPGDEFILRTYANWPDVPYISGPETRPDGTEYELPAMYNDRGAALVNSYNLENIKINLLVNGESSKYSDDCVFFNRWTLIPADAFTELGCQVEWDADAFVATISYGGNVLEIVPYLTGMRKNRADGYYVPISGCARFIDGVLYVPARAVAEELGMTVGYSDATATVTINN